MNPVIQVILCSILFFARIWGRGKSFKLSFFSFLLSLAPMDFVVTCKPFRIGIIQGLHFINIQRLGFSVHFFFKYPNVDIEY